MRDIYIYMCASVCAIRHISFIKHVTFVNYGILLVNAVGRENVVIQTMKDVTEIRCKLRQLYLQRTYLEVIKNRLPLFITKIFH